MTLAARFLAVLALITTFSLSASSLFVSPAGTDTGNDCRTWNNPCLTIQRAVDQAAPGEEIKVAAGTYTGQVTIDRRESLELIGEPGATLVAPAGGVPSLIAVNNSRGIGVRGFVLQGNDAADATIGVTANHSDLILRDTTVQDMGGGGVVLFVSSDVWVRNCVLKRNRSNALRVDEGSTARVGTGDAAESVVMEDNPYQGIGLGLGGTVLLRGNVLIQRNAYGIYSNGGSLYSCCAEDPGDGVRILSNSIGASFKGGHLALRGRSLIEGNTSVGIRLIGATANLNHFSSVPIVVRQNGTAGQAMSGGIVMTGSHLEAPYLEVTGNLARGILMQDGSTARLITATVTGNAAEGIRVETHSVVRLLTVTASGNKGADVSCSRNSAGAGDASGVGKLSCADFEQDK